ncbi:hypothetical protein FHS59_002107 [Algoriphagus iocasae]|uniref:DUF4382 domain-containing protein n=1 Tax=Algoriphagus iocasae TaxID=1836499 RepID=A0A841MM18_9BACT|nr:DUF4382 domain-containing protein [Algoriphagus iocasae]MBB6326479.1 hypothetical protein [Algoriphagus iocasae]
MNKIVSSFFLAFLLFSLWSCEKFDSNPKGLVNVILVDAPATWDSVFVEILGVDIEIISAGKDDGQIETFFLPYEPGDKKIEVSSLIGGEALLLGRDELPDGKILKVTVQLGDEYYLFLDEKRYNMPLFDPSTTEIPIDFEMEIIQGIAYDVVLDFDLEKSIIVTSESPLTLQLDPKITAIKGAGTGEITGIIKPSAIQPAIYAIQNGDSVSTHSNSSGTYEFRITEGKYSIYFDPKNETYADTVIHDLEVLAGETLTIDLVTLKLKP